MKLKLSARVSSFAIPIALLVLVSLFVRRAADQRRNRAATTFVEAFTCCESAPQPRGCATQLEAARSASLELPGHGPRELEAISALSDLDAASSSSGRDAVRTKDAVARARRAAAALGWQH